MRGRCTFTTTGCDDESAEHDSNPLKEGHAGGCVIGTETTSMTELLLRTETATQPPSPRTAPFLLTKFFVVLSQEGAWLVARCLANLRLPREWSWASALREVHLGLLHAMAPRGAIWRTTPLWIPRTPTCQSPRSPMRGAQQMELARSTRRLWRRSSRKRLGGSDYRAARKYLLINSPGPKNRIRIM